MNKTIILAFKILLGLIVLRFLVRYLYHKEWESQMNVLDFETQDGDSSFVTNFRNSTQINDSQFVEIDSDKYTIVSMKPYLDRPDSASQIVSVTPPLKAYKKNTRVTLS